MHLVVRVHPRLGDKDGARGQADHLSTPRTLEKSTDVSVIWPNDPTSSEDSESWLMWPWLPGVVLG